jgi:hypothetical protein
MQDVSCLSTLSARYVSLTGQLILMLGTMLTI